jgi:hypothetical protein
MSPDPAGMRTPSERRRNPLLRALIEEMLEHVREVNRHAAEWTPEERARAEAELSAIMSRVRGAATGQDTTT